MGGTFQPAGNVMDQMETRASALLLGTYRTRDALFGGDLFPGGAWEILLTLDAAAAELTVQQICASTGGSRGSSERWVCLLAQRGFVEVRQSGAAEPRFALTWCGSEHLQSVLALLQPQCLAA